MSAPTRPWRKAAAVAAAGGIAFASGVGFTLSSVQEGEPVLPILRTPGAAPSDVAAAAPAAAAPAFADAPRLSSGVTHNPFGELNLQPPALAALGTPKGQDATAVAAAAPARKAARPAAPPAPPSTLAAPAPTAPPLPFTVVGSIAGPEVTGGPPVVFLQQQDRLIVVRIGDGIDGTYRVESVSAQRMELMYLPLMQRQALELSSRGAP